MFPIRPRHIKRISFATQMYPKLKSSFGIKVVSTASCDGEVFCGGRSVNKDLLTFFGCIADPPGGSSAFVQLPLFRRSIQKLVNLIETELQLIGAKEMLQPTIIPQKLWTQSKRLERQPDAMSSIFTLNDSSDSEFLLAPTHEESITKLIGNLDPLEEQDLPHLMYQTSPKFRREPNPRFGLLRTNEFLMNDMYSFDVSIEKAKQTYELVTKVYDKIFAKLKLNCMRFESATGSIGGLFSHEYQLPLSSGEDNVVQCNSCNLAYNAEMCHDKGAEFDHDYCIKCKSTDINRLQTLELAHTFLLSDIYSKPLGARITRDDGTKAYFQMGCYGLGLTRIIGAGVDLYSLVPKQNSDPNESFIQLRWPSGVEPFKVGIVTPAKRSKQYNGGSTEFVRNLVTKIVDSTQEIDVLVEDRDKDGIRRRLAKLQSIGIPNIIVVGQRFLQDEPEVEVLKLDSSKQRYEQNWMTEDQVCDFVRELDI